MGRPRRGGFSLPLNVDAVVVVDVVAGCAMGG